MRKFAGYWWLTDFDLAIDHANARASRTGVRHRVKQVYRRDYHGRVWIVEAI